MQLKEQFLEFMQPPTAVPRYDILEFMAKDQKALDCGKLLPISPEAIAKGEATVAEYYRELQEEATRLVDRELRLLENSRQLHANASQFGLVAAGIVA